MAISLWETRIRKLFLYGTMQHILFHFCFVLLCILKHSARLCFSIKCFHRNLALWNFPATMLFFPLNTAMAQSVYLFNCFPFHWLQWCLLFKLIKNSLSNPDEVHTHRLHPVGGYSETYLICAYNAGICTYGSCLISLFTKWISSQYS